MGHTLDTARLEELLSGFPPTRASLIPMLQSVQADFGYVPLEAVAAIASRTGVFPCEVVGVITFYGQFHTTPRGRNVIRVCRGKACHVKGGHGMLRTVMKFTGLNDGETSEDLRFTLETVACLGACALSPVMIANNNLYGRLNQGRVEALLRNLP